MLLLFTDFGLEGPYTGQIKAVLTQRAARVPVIDLCANAPAFNPRAGAYLLAAYGSGFPTGSVFLCVIDPGVGSEERDPVVLSVDGRHYVGPDNGLFELVTRRGQVAQRRVITWRPARLAPTFHGRDLFAPVAAALACGETPDRFCEGPTAPYQRGWPDDSPEVIYVDHYGNLVTALRAESLPAAARLEVGGRVVPRARTFADVASGAAFCYENSSGLIEIAVNRGRADEQLGVAIGDQVRVCAPEGCG